MGFLVTWLVFSVVALAATAFYFWLESRVNRPISMRVDLPSDDYAYESMSVMPSDCHQHGLSVVADLYGLSCGDGLLSTVSAHGGPGVLAVRRPVRIECQHCKLSQENPDDGRCVGCWADLPHVLECAR